HDALPIFVTEVAEDHAAQGARHETYRESGVSEQGTNIGVVRRKIEAVEHQPGHYTVKKEVVPLDGSAYHRGGDDPFDGFRVCTHQCLLLGPCPRKSGSLPLCLK